MSPAALRAATVRLPDAVVFRALAAETVLLDLRTGRYHGLDPRAAALIAALVRAGSPSSAAQLLAANGTDSLDAVEEELCELCLALADQGLLEVTLDPTGARKPSPGLGVGAP
jgi:hypothetical protein